MLSIARQVRWLCDNSEAQGCGSVDGFVSWTNDLAIAILDENGSTIGSHSGTCENCINLIGDGLANPGGRKEQCSCSCREFLHANWRNVEHAGAAATVT